MRALVLGASGHLGSAFTRELLGRGFGVTAAARRRRRAPNLLDLPVSAVWGDADRPEQLDEWVPGHDLVVDAAAPYHFQLASEQRGSDAIERGRERMDALLDRVARADACLIHVSSFTTLSRTQPLLEMARSGALRRLHPYFDLKQAMEERVRVAAARGVRAVIVNPTLCLGPWDAKPLPFCWIPLAVRGELPATSSRAVNVVDVRDVAAMSVDAAARERFGEPIALSGHNTTLQAMTATLCGLAGVPPPRRRAPAHLAALTAWGNERLASAGLSPLDYPSLGMILLLEQRWVSPGPAQRALGAPFRSLTRTLADALQWYRELGYLETPASGRSPTGSRGSPTHRQGWPRADRARPARP